MLRSALLFRLILAASALVLILNYLHTSWMVLFGCLLFWLLLLMLFLLCIAMELTHVIARHRGKPVLGFIMKHSRGLKILGEREVVVHVATTDGSHVLMEHKINTKQADRWIYPINTFCVLYKYHDSLSLGKDIGDIDRYFEPEDVELLGSIVKKTMDELDASYV